MALWRGPVLAGLDSRLQQLPAVVALHTARVTAVLDLADLREAHRQVLRGAGSRRTRPALPPPAAPAQLPPDPVGFTGRAADVLLGGQDGRGRYR
ncbi:hypothetical protein ACFO1B_31170 [Dactylosporangium siamense]|uniref:hypothetical protein n=1 Tax=Dactylosporangium siamense TaxID=685454 RepID=UPI003608D740